MLSLALACGGLAASEVSSRMSAVEARVGAPVPVLVAARGVKGGDELGRRDVAVREVPERFAPPDALRTPEEALGLAPAAPVVKGAYLTAAAVGGGGHGAERAGPRALRRGERAVEVAVAGGGVLGEAVGPGGRVDVLISTDAREGAGRTFLALQDVELLDLQVGGGESAGGAESPDEGAAARASAVATLRVTLRQAVYLTAAQNFAREVRLLPRPAGDGRRLGRTGVSANGL
jgi:pilus assembly protein CpaB